MSPTYNGPGAGSGAHGAGNRIAKRQSVSDSTTTRTAPELHRFRRQRAAEIVHRLGARAVYELLAEISRHHPTIADDIDRKLERYAERLSPDLLRATGGDR